MSAAPICFDGSRNKSTIMKLFGRFCSEQKGLAMPMVLLLMILGGLTLAPAINFAASGLTGIQKDSMSLRGLYAADAGVEDAIWSIQQGQVPPVQLTESVNDMAVTRQVVERGMFTLYLGQFVETGVHNGWLELTGVLDPDPDPYNSTYTVTVQWQPDSGYSTIHLAEIGAKLPPGYSYRPFSVLDFSENISIEEPSRSYDSAGAEMVNWVFGTPRPSVTKTDGIATQTFLLDWDGYGDPNGDYAWLVAARTDIGIVGTVTGGLYSITSTAMHGDIMTGRVVAEVMVMDSIEAYIVSWEVTK